MMLICENCNKEREDTHLFAPTMCNTCIIEYIELLKRNEFLLTKLIELKKGKGD